MNHGCLRRHRSDHRPPSHVPRSPQKFRPGRLQLPACWAPRGPGRVLQRRLSRGGSNHVLMNGIPVVAARLTLWRARAWRFHYGYRASSASFNEIRNPRGTFPIHVTILPPTVRRRSAKRSSQTYFNVHQRCVLFRCLYFVLKPLQTVTNSHEVLKPRYTKGAVDPLPHVT